LNKGFIIMFKFSNSHSHNHNDRCCDQNHEPSPEQNQGHQNVIPIVETDDGKGMDFGPANLPVAGTGGMMDQMIPMTMEEQMLHAVKTGATEIVRRLVEGKQGKLRSRIITNEDGTTTEVSQTIEEWLSTPQDGFYYTHFAAKLGDIEQLEILSNKGCPLLKPSLESVGMYPIHWACTTNQLKCVHWLLEQGADIDCRDAAQATPLIVAAQYGHANIVAYLIKNGANINLLDKYKDSCLHWGAYKGNVEIVGLLCHLGLPINEQDDYGQTPVHLAALRGNMAAVEYLVIDMKAELHLKDKNQKTPLMLAEEKKKFGVVKFLKGQSGAFQDKFYMLKFLFTREFLMIFLSGGRGAESSSWPLYLMVGSMTVISSMFYLRLLCAEMGNHSFMLAVSLLLFITMWVFLYLCRSDIGYCSDTDSDLRNGYEERLEMMACFETTEKLGTRRFRNLCHTCHIERPLRTKHCKACRKCVRVFDHHCPFTGCCIARNNYRWFYLFVLFFNLSAISYLILAVIYLREVKRDWLVIMSFLYVCTFEMPAFGLFNYHTGLIRKGVTTNEDMNFWRLQYLKDENGKLKSPWNYGTLLKNFLSRLHLDPGIEIFPEDAAPLLPVNVV